MFTRIFYRALTHYFLNGYSPTYSFQATNVSGSTVTVTSKLETIFDYLDQGFVTANTSMSGRGVVFGDGDTAPTIDDFQLAGKQFKTFSYDRTWSLNDNCDTATVTFTLTNTGTTAFTIREVAFLASANSTTFVIMREVLDSPVTIEPSGIGQVSFSVKINIPVA